MKHVHCPKCDNEYQNLGSHIRQSGCQYPESLDPDIEEMLVGLILGDADVNLGEDNNYPCVRIHTSKEEYAEYLDDYLGWISTGINKYTAGYGNTMFIVMTRRASLFSGWRGRFYNSGTKHYPDELRLTPTIAKYWYVSDGNLHWSGDYCVAVEIGCKGQLHQSDLLVDLFDDIGLTAKINNNSLRLSVDDSRDFLDWIGEPVPTYEYKWEMNSREKYRNLK